MTAPTKAAVEAFLAELGSTPDKVAASLTRLGVHGHRRTSIGCPIAVALAQQFGGYWCVARFYAWPTGLALAFEEITVNASIPAPVSRFTQLFDQGGYPELCSP
jgi:hypothetical protein